MTFFILSLCSMLFSRRCLWPVRWLLDQYHQVTCCRAVKTVYERQAEENKQNNTTRKFTFSRGLSVGNRLSDNINTEKLTSKQHPGKSLYFWGYAAAGALGFKSQGDNSLQHSPRRLQLQESHMPVLVSLGCGYSVFTCATEDGHQIYGCGLNTNKQLGIQNDPENPNSVLDFVTEPVLINVDSEHQRLGSHRNKSKIMHVSCGKAHTWIVTEDNTVFSFGSNVYGQCGRPAKRQSITRSDQSFVFPEKIKQVCCGLDHTLILTDKGDVYSCGMGADGQTGLGHYKIVDELVKVGGDIKDEKIIFLSSKADTVLAISETGDVFGWGNTEYGQLSVAVGNVMQINEPRHLPFVHKTKFVQAAAAGSMCGLLDEQGDIYTWGYGLLGHGQNVDHQKLPQQIPRSVFAMNHFDKFDPFIQMTCGLTYFAAVTEGGQLFMWGRQNMSCLGSGNNQHQMNISKPTKVDIPSSVTFVSCGVDHTAVLCTTVK